VSRPLATVTAGGNHHGLVIPYRNAAAKTTGEPLHTLSTKDSAGLLHPAPAVEDCYFRMIQPREQLLAQRFPADYIVHGNKGEQTMQAGNAVSSNVAQWIGERVKAVL
jgi:DNA (cytosine-5)-methyltransferase 1